MTGPIIQLKIETLNSDGSGVARLEGKVYFVPRAVPGDTVEVQIEKEHKQYTDCRVIKFIVKSSDRVEPPCPYFFECGGCQLQHLKYLAQTRHKTEMVRHALSRIGKVDPSVVLETISSPDPWHYRSRIQVHRNKSGEWGFYKNQSHDVIPVKECRIADSEVNRQLMALSDHKSQVTGHRSQVSLETCDLRSAKSLTLRSDNLPAFAQAHSGMNARLVDQVLKFTDPQPQDKIFDLYAGAGNYAFELAPKVAWVVAVERDQTSVDFGMKEADRLKLTNMSWRQGVVYQALKQVKQEGHKCHKMVVNPPRQGLEEAVDSILSFHPQKIIYVSCDPATLSRDAQRLTQSGYKLIQCQPLDMFPQTIHVESVSLFES